MGSGIEVRERERGKYMCVFGGGEESRDKQ